MTKSSKETQIQIIHDMRAMIGDYKKDKKRYPTLTEFSKTFELSQRTMLNYRSLIQQEDRDQLLELFANDLVPTAENLIKTIDENIEVFRHIRDDTELSSGLRMDAAKNMEESYIDQLRIKRDGPQFLTGNYSGDPIKDDDSKDVTKPIITSDIKVNPNAKS